MELLNNSFLSGLVTVILLDLVLAGDNAIVVAMVAHSLPRPLQTKAVFWGTFGAVAVRVLLTVVVVYLLKLPGLMLAGGLLLLPIAWNLLKHHEPDPDIHASRGLWAALRAIIVADALMGLDNVLAIAGASKGHLGLVVLGLLISVPLVVWGSTLILKLIQRFPFIIYVGAAAVAWTAARMITQDPITGDWFAEHLPIAYLLDAMLVASTSIGGWLMNRRRHA